MRPQKKADIKKTPTKKSPIPKKKQISNKSMSDANRASLTPQTRIQDERL